MSVSKARSLPSVKYKLLRLLSDFRQKKTPQIFDDLRRRQMRKGMLPVTVTSLFRFGIQFFLLTCLPSALKNIDFTGFFLVFLCQSGKWPKDIFDDVIDYSIKEQGNKALEIGAGTGKATAPFLEKGYDVTAVEISGQMAQFLAERFKNNKMFRVIVSSFENATLEENNYNLIYAASAFHWVDAEIGCPKAFRLLKNGGTFALLRYNFDYIPHGGQDFHGEIRKAYEKYFFSYYTSQRMQDAKMVSKIGFEENPRILTGYGFEDLKTYGFHDITMNLYEKEFTYHADEWVNLLDTLSNHRNLPESNRKALYSKIKEIMMEHGNLWYCQQKFAKTRLRVSDQAAF